MVRKSTGGDSSAAVTPLVTKKMIEAAFSENKVALKIPKSLGAAVDLFYETQKLRLAMQKVVDEVARNESALRDYLIDNIPKSNLTGVAGKLARATIVPKKLLQVKNWDAFYAYIKRKGAFELLQRRISEGAVRERFDDSKTGLPGVEEVEIKKVSINKV